MAASPTQRDGAAKSAQLVAAATDLFARSGLQVTQAQIAEAAGVGVASVYRRFPTKDELILAVYGARLHQAVDLAASASEVADPWEGLEMFLRQSSFELANDLGFRDLILGGYAAAKTWSRRETTADLSEALRLSDARVAEHLSEVIRRAQKMGQLRLDFDVTDVQLVSVAVQSSAVFGGAENPDLYLRTLGLLLDGLRPSRAAASPLPVAPLDREQLERITARVDRPEPPPS